MSVTFDRHTFPNGGWQFYQPQTGWAAPTPKSSTFDQTVVLIIRHRQQNAAIAARHGLALDSVNVGNELEMFTRARLNIPLPINVPKPMPQPSSPPAVAAGSSGILKVAHGSGPILEWLASGRPAVDRPIAERRAALCSDCPKNDNTEATLLQWFVVQAAKVVKLAVEARQDLKLESTQDPKLGVCTACLCGMKVKVHCPHDIITKYLKPEVAADMDPRCWITKPE